MHATAKITQFATSKMTSFATICIFCSYMTEWIHRFIQHLLDKTITGSDRMDFALFYKIVDYKKSQLMLMRRARAYHRLC